MTEKERLTDLIRGYFIGVGDTFSNDTITSLADYLIANGVRIPVRCEECVYHHWCQEPSHGKTEHYCGLPYMGGIGVFKGYFCCYGERKTDNDY